MITCGYLDRLVANQSNYSSPQNVPDPLVRVFDLRMSKAMSTLTMTVSTARHVKFIPSSAHTVFNDQPLVLMASSSGVLQINAMTKIIQVLTFPMQSKKDTIAALSVASSGNLLTAASSSGYILQYALGLSHGHANSVNERVAHMHIPNQPKLDLSIPLNSPSAASSYVLRPHPQDPIPLASSFASTPNIMNRKYQVHPQRIVSKDLITKAIKREFIHTVPNPGYPPNSMIFTIGCDVYEMSDPRLIETHADVLAIESSIPLSYRRIESKVGIYNKQNKSSNSFDYNVFNESSMIGLDNKCPNSYTNAILQLLFHLSDIRSFALSAQTQSAYHKNEHSLWCELGFLFHMMITKSQNIRGLNSEDLIIDESHKIIGDVLIEKDKVVTPSNFQKTFQHLDEAAALGLLGDSKATTDHSLQILNFCRFIFLNLHKEYENVSSGINVSSPGYSPSKHSTLSTSPIESLFGFSVSSVNTFLPSGVVDKQASQSLLSLDISYNRPINSSTKSNLGATTSFPVNLWHSFRKESSFRAWCAATEAYERCNQLRSVLSLPRVLTLVGNDMTRTDVETQWIPSVLEIAMLMSPDDSVERLIISGKFESVDLQEHWIIYDGTIELQSVARASRSLNYTTTPPMNSVLWKIHEMSLIAVVNNVKSTSQTHAVSHLLIDSQSKRSESLLNPQNDEPLPSVDESSKWYLFNDFSISESSFSDATSLEPFKSPILIAFSNTNSGVRLTDCELIDSLSQYAIPSSVMQLPSLSKTQSIFPLKMPSRGDIAAIDAEFVSVELGSSVISSDGKRIMNTDGRQIMARLSIIDGKGSADNPLVYLDDYILPDEPIIDYVTKFSGISEDDLSPSSSQHALVTRRSCYLKLRHFIDIGVVFIGHGLQKDFETANVVIPCNQVRDTVELWRLPSQRLISLKFLASYLLKEKIQDEIHDSIEDAKTSLQLYRHYIKLMRIGRDHFEAVLKEIYSYGQRTNWTIGVEKLLNK
eukprot:CAMPEP_0196767966 /NCGR_PEP_ID=MMETSP1095-20130614/42179_1 /TAXON_ID=96789 ORGANISM="Chromulina nebulosa, Strain UTEXLB2642" /NCGR_SAMPLE_ID=MMETSP1095 /ASSEMBLY_ACC=CAM_ASM_000446 /LENGTH=986 /DNA_ID=CAMNT_0042136881 /DNA_START=191 /DNA_END=3151 /DNA_ORIENTATION=-